MGAFQRQVLIVQVIKNKKIKNNNNNKINNKKKTSIFIKSKMVSEIYFACVNMLILTMVCEDREFSRQLLPLMYFYFVSRDTTANTVLQSLVITYIVIFITIHYPPLCKRTKNC